MCNDTDIPDLLDLVAGLDGQNVGNVNLTQTSLSLLLDPLPDTAELVDPPQRPVDHYY